MAETPVSTNREDWVRKALEILVEEGAGEVKILTLANRIAAGRRKANAEGILAELATARGDD